MKKKRGKTTTALLVTNPYLADPKFREFMTVQSVYASGQQEGVKVSRKKVYESYRLTEKELTVF